MLGAHFADRRMIDTPRDYFKSAMTLHFDGPSPAISPRMRQTSRKQAAMPLSRHASTRPDAFEAATSRCHRPREYYG